MQTAITLRKSSINSIAATFAVLVALTLGGAGGYLLKGQVSSALTTAAPPAATTATRQKGLGHDMPEYGLSITDNPRVVLGHDYDH
jgi:hypothetical protein